ncbi:hypothetical protein [Halalkalibacter okhensis]|uniref:Lipoprotein n=1 Tax=Halalkalibacter okhensis TaxID=333138 RepID=A0A0B0IBN1_9BACI|nr:hypothetical protein [Halalkalibacter okhensis]KHF38705.1 hypothetical protein LQ50_19710 [Halalkalibacter okhensis]
MKRKNHVTALLAYLMCSLLLLGGCASATGSGSQEVTDIEEVTEHEQVVMYENSDKGIKVYELPNWEFEEQLEKDQFNVIFQSDKGKAIITVLDSIKDVEDIKNELMIGVGTSTIIEETDHYFAFESERKESIRADIYIEQQGQKVTILTFMTPLDDYEEKIESIEEFKQHIDFY